MYYYGYGNGGCNPCNSYQNNQCYNPCQCGGNTGGFGSGSGWIAIILVVFLLLVLCSGNRRDGIL